MIVGDLVKFTPPEIFNSAKKEYAEPGIIIEVRETNEMSPNRSSYTVRWHDGRITNEHECYIGKAY